MRYCAATFLLIACALAQGQEAPAAGNCVLRFHFDAAISETMWALPVRGYVESEADFEMRSVPQADGRVQFSLVRLRRPAYTLLTIGVASEEVHARVVGGSIEEAAQVGRAAIRRWCEAHPAWAAVIPETKRKPLPFLFDADPEGKLSFALKPGGVLDAGSLRNELRSHYAWTAQRPFHHHADEALCAALRLFSYSSSPGESATEVTGIKETFAQVLATLLPEKATRFLPVEGQPLPVKTSWRREGEKTRFECEGASGIALREGFALSSYRREAIWANPSRTLESDRIGMHAVGSGGDSANLVISILRQ